MADGAHAQFVAAIVVKPCEGRVHPLEQAGTRGWFLERYERSLTSPTTTYCRYCTVVPARGISPLLSGLRLLASRAAVLSPTCAKRWASKGWWWRLGRAVAISVSAMELHSVPAAE